MRKLVTILSRVKINDHSYKAFRESIRSDSLRKIINLIGLTQAN
jgi:hypothetical protein